MEELKDDIKKFTRKIRLQEYFHNDSENKSTTDTSLAKNKGNYNPYRNRNIVLDTINDFMTKFPIEELTTSIKKSNINRKESLALRELQNNKNIIIKQADRGGAVVIMDRDYYANKILEILKDDETYIQLHMHTDEEVIKKIGRLSEKYKDELTKEEKEYLTKFNHRMSNFYGLPKIHKSQSIITHSV